MPKINDTKFNNETSKSFAVSMDTKIVIGLTVGVLAIGGLSLSVYKLNKDNLNVDDEILDEAVIDEFVDDKELDGSEMDFEPVVRTSMTDEEIIDMVTPYMSVFYNMYGCDGQVSTASDEDIAKIICLSAEKTATDDTGAECVSREVFCQMARKHFGRNIDLDTLNFSKTSSFDNIYAISGWNNYPYVSKAGIRMNAGDYEEDTDLSINKIYKAKDNGYCVLINESEIPILAIILMPDVNSDLGYSIVDFMVSSGDGIDDEIYVRNYSLQDGLDKRSYEYKYPDDMNFVYVSIEHITDELVYVHYLATHEYEASGFSEYNPAFGYVEIPNFEYYRFEPTPDGKMNLISTRTMETTHVLDPK